MPYCVIARPDAITSLDEQVAADMDVPAVQKVILVQGMELTPFA